jgi:hypothetical protein
MSQDARPGYTCGLCVLAWSRQLLSNPRTDVQGNSQPSLSGLTWATHLIFIRVIFIFLTRSCISCVVGNPHNAGANGSWCGDRVKRFIPHLSIYLASQSLYWTVTVTATVTVWLAAPGELTMTGTL